MLLAGLVKRLHPLSNQSLKTLAVHVIGGLRQPIASLSQLELSVQCNVIFIQKSTHFRILSDRRLHLHLCKVADTWFDLLAMLVQSENMSHTLLPLSVFEFI
jgi:hypothetical protein